MSLLKKA